MIKALFTILLMGSLPATALTLEEFEGRWRGEGALILDAEPEQRFSCRIRLNRITDGQSFFSGRCATAQASQSFTYMLFESTSGALIAENRAISADSLPSRMAGRASPGLLLVEGGDEALFELRLDGDVMTFRIEGDGPQGVARGAAQMTRHP